MIFQLPPSAKRQVTAPLGFIPRGSAALRSSASPHALFPGYLEDMVRRERVRAERRAAALAALRIEQR